MIYALDPPIGIESAGLTALNKTISADHVEIEGSNPERPTYGAMVEVFHQLHCLVSSYHITVNLSRRRNGN